MTEDLWGLFVFSVVFSKSKLICSSGTKLWEWEQGKFFSSERISFRAFADPASGSFSRQCPNFTGFGFSGVVMSCSGSRIGNLPEGGFFLRIPNILWLIPARFCVPRNIPAPAVSPASSRKSLMIPGTRESRDIQYPGTWRDNGSSNKEI